MFNASKLTYTSWKTTTALQTLFRICAIKSVTLTQILFVTDLRQMGKHNRNLCSFLRHFLYLHAVMLSNYKLPSNELFESKVKSCHFVTHKFLSRFPVSFFETFFWLRLRRKTPTKNKFQPKWAMAVLWGKIFLLKLCDRVMSFSDGVIGAWEKHTRSNYSFPFNIN